MDAVISAVEAIDHHSILHVQSLSPAGVKKVKILDIFLVVGLMFR